MSGAGGLLLIADFTTANFAAMLRKRADLPVVEAPFDRVDPVLLGDDATAWAQEPEWALVWTRPERAIAGFQRRLRGEDAPIGELLAEVDAFASRLAVAAGRVRALFVTTWGLSPDERGLGLGDADPARGVRGALTAMNLRLAEAAADMPRVFLLDAQRWIALAGRSAVSPKLWYLNKTPFAAAVFDAAAADVLAGLAAVRGRTRKLLVLDLDETLWGGLVGEDGWENLRLGGHDPIGEALADFQRGLQALARRGILLGIVSKNDEAVALEAVRRHPEMILRERDFAGWRINWNDKAQNLVELAAELQLGLDSVVFIDDHPHERARVREALPEVFVPEWPTDKLLYPSALAALDCFDRVRLTAEDRQRTDMYVAERHRRALQQEVPSVDEWLAGLGICVTVEPYGPANAARVAQLLNKTNQMNLRTRRLTEAELTAWVDPPRRRLWAFRVRDRFGDSGLCGILGLEAAGEVAEVTDFVLSCRVLGRQVEAVILRTAVDAARAAGARRVDAPYRATEKNRPCLEYFARCGFRRDGDVFSWVTEEAYAAPRGVTVEFAEPAGAGAAPRV